MLLNVCTVSTFLNSRMSISASKILTQPSYSKHTHGNTPEGFSVKLSSHPDIPPPVDTHKLHSWILDCWFGWLGFIDVTLGSENCDMNIFPLFFGIL